MITIRNYIAKKIFDNLAFILSIILLFSVRWSFADHYRVPTGSMLPTIQIGDHVFVNKMAYDIKLPFSNIVLHETAKPQRGEIVVFKYPKDPSLNYVKRLIGLPGDTIEVLNGFIKINGLVTPPFPKVFQNQLKKLYTENSKFTYIETIGDKEFRVQRLPYASRKHHLKFVVPDDKYFFMGDNRDNSADSRSWGFVPREYLKGRVTNVTMSVAFDGIIPKFNFYRFGKKLI